MPCKKSLCRLDLAFQAFFRRVKAGQTPGFPRFKASKRFSGFCCPDPAGWKLYQQGQRGGTLRLGSGKNAMSIRLRGQHRFGAETKSNDLSIIRKNGEWFASVTLRVPESACARVRTHQQHRGIDFGLTIVGPHRCPHAWNRRGEKVAMLANADPADSRL